MGISIKDIEKFKRLPYDDRKSLMFKLPVPVLNKFYLDYCDNNQVIDVLLEWDQIFDVPEKFPSLGDPIFVKKKFLKRIKGLIRGLEKKRKSHILPRSLYNRYKNL